MIKRLTVLALVSLVVVPAALATSGTTSSARTQCTNLKASMGAQFGQTYSSFGACVSKLAPIDQANNSTAQSSCQTEQSDVNFAASHGGKTFDQYYGSGKQGKNAFGQCVSSKEQASAAAEHSLSLNPSKTCQASRTQMGVAAFGQLYGTNASKSNAFGKCVSKAAQAQVGNEVSAVAQCRSDATVTGSTEANAFGQCVAQKTQSANASDQQKTVSAAKTCSSELKSSGATAFKAKYHTFGGCVSQHAKAA